MANIIKWLGLQLFGGEGGGAGAGAGASAAAGDGAAAAAGESTPDAGEARLRELGVPEHVLAKNRAKRTKNAAAAPAAPAAESEPAQQAAAAEEDTTPAEGQTAAETAPKRMSWDEIMADPEYNRQMQQTIQARLRSAKGAEESMAKLAPAIELLAGKYGLDAKNLDASALAKAITEDDGYYEDKALEMGVSVETAKRIDQTERQAARLQEAQARMQAEQARLQEQAKIKQHIAQLQQQGDALKKTFKSFDLATELRNPAFARMTSPQIGLSVEDAYYAVHRKEIQAAAMQVTTQKTAEQIAKNIRAGQARPVENGTSAQAPSNTTFDYAHASREQRDALKRQIREAAAKGQKIYPGQR